MYTPDPIAGTVVITGTTLAVTGLNILWISLGGFALISAGLALMRLAGRREA